MPLVVVSLYPKFTINGYCAFQLTVIQGDITKVAADAIVHPTNNSFYMGGEVGRAIEKAGGAKFAEEVKDLQKKHGDLATSDGE